MTDDRDYIQKTIELSEATNGRKPTPEELAVHFLAHGREKRGQILDSIKTSSRNQEYTIKQAADRMAYERALSRAQESRVRCRD
jgi:hypothetical protein